MTPEERVHRAFNQFWPLPLGDSLREIAERVMVAVIRQLVEDEREACALVAYNYPAPDPGVSWRESIGAAIRRRGAAIRRRGEAP